MENNHEIYQAPDVEVVEMKSEGVICSSGKRVNYGIGGDEEWE